MDSDQQQGKSISQKVKETRIKEKLASVRKKYDTVKLTPTKFQAVVDEFSSSDCDTAESDSDVDSEVVETETAAEEEEMHSEGTESDGEATEQRGLGSVCAGGGPAAPSVPRITTTPRTSRMDTADWSTDNTAPFVDIFTGTPGLTVPVPTTPLGFVQLFITRDLLKYFADETNLYASHSLANASHQARNEWDEVNVREIAKFLGITMLMGVIKAPRMTMYWQTGKKWHVPAFNACMTSKRYATIAKYFHTYNNNAIPNDNTDRLIKVRTVMEYLTNKYKTYYIPQKHLSLDEGSMAWRGRLAFKVYNPNKPDKYGVKMYMLAESKTGYIFDFEVYAGIGKSTIETVMSLVAPLKDKGYHLYMDNYYNSVRLSEQLLEQSFYTCGTIRLQRGAPKDLQLEAKKKLPADTTIFRRKGNVFLILWKDKRVVSVITTCHNADKQEVERRKRIRNRDGSTSVQQVTVNKPKAICDYNEHMKGVDHFDQMVKYYHFTRKCQKWTKKITFYFLQMAIHNAFVLYQYYTADTKRLSFLQFHELLIDSLMDFEYIDWPIKYDIRHAPDIHEGDSNSADDDVASPAPTPGPSSVRRPLFPATPRDDNNSSSDSEDEVVTTPGKRPRIMDKPERMNKNLNHTLLRIEKKLRCRVCYKSGKRQDTRYKCKSCDVALCAAPCHGLYHRKKNYWVAKQ